MWSCVTLEWWWGRAEVDPHETVVSPVFLPSHFYLPSSHFMKHVASRAIAKSRSSMSTSVVSVSPWRLGRFIDRSPIPSSLPLEDWTIELSNTDDANALNAAAIRLQNDEIPVAFPTETVYGLGADATRSAAVRGIYLAKQRPSDNPLIVHVASLKQLRTLLNSTSDSEEVTTESIPSIYLPLIRKFWPGPLTILLPVPARSPLAPETTAGLKTFGARMPANLLALSLIKLADRPIAAPSANSSTKPSPTAAEHVLHDLDGRIELILDGGPCAVGVESTVVDGLCSPPCVLRPGGVSIGELRKVKGWENVRVSYEDKAGHKAGDGPRAPGMKYRHYSPKARVYVYESGNDLQLEDLSEYLGSSKRLAVVRTKRWQSLVGSKGNAAVEQEDERTVQNGTHTNDARATGLDELPRDSPFAKLLQEHSTLEQCRVQEVHIPARNDREAFRLYDTRIGPSTKEVARDLFSILRELDKRELDAIVVEGLPDDEDDISAAVMNRLRKAAETNT